MKFCLIGGRLGHSYSALIHSEFGYGYDLVELKPDELEGFCRFGGYDGFNVTIPYKKEIMRYLDIIDSGAQEAGAVNTVVRRGGKLIGYNTDVAGMEYLLKSSGISLNGKKVLILGSGGTSETAKAVCARQNALEIVVVSRNGEDNYQNIFKHYDAEAIINTTPVGMYPENGKTPLDIGPFNNLLYVVDAVYNPLKTALVFDAEERGIKCSSGLKMLIAQAKFSRDLFLGDAAADGEIERIYKKLLSGILNIVFIGMPSSGKTTVGKKLAEKLLKKFVDTDEEIERIFKKSVERIFAENGEAAFRKAEREVIERIGKEKGQVISTGGGAVKAENAYRALKQNGVIVYLIRSPEKTDMSGRPLLKEDGAYQRLLAEREPVYKKFADITANNDGGIEDIINEITEGLYESIGD